jgi:hypothetical protein
MAHNLGIVAFAFAIGQTPAAQPAPMLDTDAYAIYATLLPRASGQPGGVILILSTARARRRWDPSRAAIRASARAVGAEMSPALAAVRC